MQAGSNFQLSIETLQLTGPRRDEIPVRVVATGSLSYRHCDAPAVCRPAGAVINCLRVPVGGSSSNRGWRITPSAGIAMRAARIHRFGPPELIVIDDLPRRSPGGILG
jgi:hypothetical protein